VLKSGLVLCVWHERGKVEWPTAVYVHMSMVMYKNGFKYLNYTYFENCSNQ